MVAAFSVVEQMAELVEELDMRKLANAMVMGATHSSSAGRE